MLQEGIILKRDTWGKGLASRGFKYQAFLFKKIIFSFLEEKTILNGKNTLFTSVWSLLTPEHNGIHIIFLPNMNSFYVGNKKIFI